MKISHAAVLRATSGPRRGSEALAYDRRVGQIRTVAVVRALAIGCVGLLLAGCGGGDGDADRAASTTEPADGPSTITVSLPPEEPGIRMSFVQQRIWEGTPKADVRIANITERALPLRRIGISWPGYPSVLRATDVRVGAGQTLDVHLRLPEPDCDVDAEDVGATGIAVTGSRTVRRVIDDAGMRFLTRIWSADCARRRVADLVTIAYDVPDPSVAADVPEGGSLDSTLPLGLVLTRRGSADERPRVKLDQVQGSILFDLTPAGSRTLSSDADAAEVGLVADPGRCDEHARSQASQPFAFRVWLRIGDDPELVSVLAVPDRPAQRRLLAFLDAACAGITDH